MGQSLVVPAQPNFPPSVARTPRLLEGRAAKTKKVNCSSQPRSWTWKNSFQRKLKRQSDAHVRGQDQNLQLNMAPDDEIKTSCIATVLQIFPEVCPDFLDDIAKEQEYDYERVLDKLLEVQGERGDYPKRAKVSLKRKRSELDGSEDEDDDDILQVARKFDSQDRRNSLKDPAYIRFSRQLLSQAFPKMYAKDLDTVLQQNNNCLFPAFMALNKIMQEWDNDNPSFTLKKTSTRGVPEYQHDKLEEAITEAKQDWTRETLEEYHAAIQVSRAQQSKIEAEKQQAIEEEQNLKQAQEDGNVQDCECCFTEHAINRMVHCDGDTLHVSWAWCSCPSMRTVY